MMRDNIIAGSRMLLGKHRPGERLASVFVNVEFRHTPKGVEVAFATDLMSSNGLIGGGQHKGDDLRATLEMHELPESNFNNLLEIWDYWHLNGMRAGCEHQRIYKQMMTDLNIVDKSFFYVDNYDEVIKLSAFGHCPECGYRYGSEWKHERLPTWIAVIICDLFDMNIYDRERLEKALTDELSEFAEQMDKEEVS